MQANIAHPLHLTVPVDEARRRIYLIPHATCQYAAEHHWNVLDDGTVPEESVNWLFCWAKTGMGSRPAALAARSVFDGILPTTFVQYDAAVDHEYARAHRYQGLDRGDR
jgi:hypothetical protein